MLKAIRVAVVTIGLALMTFSALTPGAFGFGGVDGEGEAQLGGGGARPGGGGIALDCPAGEFVIGFSGRSGDWIDALGVLCAPLNGSGFGTLAGADELQMQGKLDGGSAFPGNSIVCPQGMAVDDIEWNMTRDPDAGHVDNIVFSCRFPDDPSGLRDQKPTIEIFSHEPGDFDISEADQLFDAECYSVNDGFATGIHIRATSSVEALDLDCGSIPVGSTSSPLVSAPPPDILKTSPTSQVGGSSSLTKSIRPQCSPPWMEVSDPSRLSVTWLRQSVSLNGITILCAKPATPATTSKVVRSLPALQCANGQTPGPGGCPSMAPTITAKRVARCPDGTPRPAGGCPSSSTVVVIPSLPPKFCNGQLVAATTPCITTPPITSGWHATSQATQLPPCPDGQTRDSNQQCPAAKKLRAIRLPSTPPSNGLH